MEAPVTFALKISVVFFFLLPAIKPLLPLIRDIKCVINIVVYFTMTKTFGVNGLTIKPCFYMVKLDDLYSQKQCNDL